MLQVQQERIALEVVMPSKAVRPFIDRNCYLKAPQREEV